LKWILEKFGQHLLIVVQMVNLLKVVSQLYYLKPLQFKSWIQAGSSHKLTSSMRPHSATDE